MWKRTIVSKIGKCNSPLWFKYIMSIAQQLIPIYNTTMHKNKSIIALNVATRHQNATRVEDKILQKVTFNVPFNY